MRECIHEREIQAPLDPLDSFLRLKGAPPGVLLDGQPPVTDKNCRALILFDPFEIVALEPDSRSDGVQGDPFPPLFDRLAALSADFPPGGARPRGAPFPGGAAGFFSYDLGRYLERLPATACSLSRAPDLWFGLFNRGLEIDLKSGRSRLFVAEIPAVGRSGAGYVERAFTQALRRLDQPVRLPPPVSAVGGELQLRSNFEREAYLRAVERVRHLIRAGDVYQVDLSQRFETPFHGDASHLYRRLRSINPAPFSALVDTGRLQVLSASPERFLARVGDKVETRPIKGTRRRTGQPGADERLAAELLHAEKDGAELAMIVDLERNDLGRVARPGTVTVVDPGRLEVCPTVFHREASVTCRLRPEIDGSALLRAVFPGGSIAGAPKIRAMEIIEELEGVRRGVFTGSMGWIDWFGDCDLNIVIRTLVLEGGRAHYHVGGGIVLDSDPAAEYIETLDKGRALEQALRGAPPPEVDFTSASGCS